jgi:hypothetical protein
MDAVVLSIVLVLLAAFVAAPLYRADRPPTAVRPKAPNGPREAALADLETDLGSGLIDRATYERERASLLAPD